MISEELVSKTLNLILIFIIFGMNRHSSITSMVQLGIVLLEVILGLLSLMSQSILYSSTLARLRYACTKLDENYQKFSL